MQFTKELSSNFCQFSLPKLASFIDSNRFNKRVQSRQEPILRRWRYILNQIFHFGSRKQTLSNQIRQVSQMQISKQEYYMALKISMKQQIDKIARTLRDIKAKRPTDQQGQPQYIQSKTLFNQLFSYTSSMMSNQQLQKCYSNTQAKQLIERNQIADEQAQNDQFFQAQKQVSEAYHSLQPKFFVKSIGHIKMVAQQTEKIIQEHQKLFGWGCACKRLQCGNKWRRGRLFQILYIYFCHTSTIFQETMKQSVKATISNQLNIKVPSDPECAEKSIQNMIEQQNKAKQNKKRKKKRSKKSSSIKEKTKQQCNHQSEQSKQTQETTQSLQYKLAKQIQILPDKLTLIQEDCKGPTKKVTITVQLGDGRKKQIQLMVAQNSQNTQFSIFQKIGNRINLSKRQSKEQKLSRQQQDQYEMVERYLQQFSIDEDQQKPCNVNQEWIGQIQKHLLKQLGKVQR